MNFLSLEYFLAIEKAGSFSAAAKKLYISQQALSEHIKKLEIEVNSPLFYRENPLALTESGICFKKYASEILQLKGMMLQDLSAIASSDECTISIGISTAEAPPFLSDLLTLFSRDYPDCICTVAKHQNAEIEETIDSVNFYFSFLPLSEKLEHILLKEQDEYAIVLNKSLFRATYGDSWKQVEDELLRFGELRSVQDLPFIILQNRHRKMEAILESIFSAADFTPIVGFRSDNGEVNSMMCINGLGAIIAPMDYIRRKYRDYLFDGGSMAAYAIHAPKLNAPLALSYRKGKQLTQIEQNFVQVAKKYFQSTP